VIGARTGGRLDIIGVVASCACACHCVALPVAVSLLPALGLHALLDERVELALLALTAAVGVASLGPAALRRRGSPGRWRAPALFAAGLALLLSARAGAGSGGGHALDAVVLAGGGLVVAAHVVNRRRARDEGVCGTRACCPCPEAEP
jgi:hypothetical protein